MGANQVKPLDHGAVDAPIGAVIGAPTTRVMGEFIDIKSPSHASSAALTVTPLDVRGSTESDSVLDFNQRLFDALEWQKGNAIVLFVQTSATTFPINCIFNTTLDRNKVSFDCDGKEVVLQWISTSGKFVLCSA